LWEICKIREFFFPMKRLFGALSTSKVASLATTPTRVVSRLVWNGCLFPPERAVRCRQQSNSADWRHWWLNWCRCRVSRRVCRNDPIRLSSPAFPVNDRRHSLLVCGCQAASFARSGSGQALSGSTASCLSRATMSARMRTPRQPSEASISTANNSDKPAISDANRGMISLRRRPSPACAPCSSSPRARNRPLSRFSRTRRLRARGGQASRNEVTSKGVEIRERRCKPSG